MLITVFRISISNSQKIFDLDEGIKKLKTQNIEDESNQYLQSGSYQGAKHCSKIGREKP